MPNPLSWSYLTAPPDQMSIWGPFSVMFLVIFALGLIGSLGLYWDAGRRFQRDEPLGAILRRASAILAPIFAAGLFFFLCRYLRVSALHLSMRLWLYLTLVAAGAVVAYYAARYRRIVRPKGEESGSLAEAAAHRWYGFIAVGLFVVYMVLAAALYVFRGVDLHPDRWAVLLFVSAVLLGQWKAFLRDWIPVVFLIFGYEFMRGLAFVYVSQRHKTIHVTELIDADKAMFGGHIPALWLQQKLYVPGTVHWYDILAVIVYALHFVYPLLFAFLLWIGNKERFWHFSLTLLLMTYVGFVFYLLYPAAPPWMANDWGNIHGLQIPFNQVWQTLAPKQYHDLDQFQIWSMVSGNPVAAMPSLHAAYPWLTMLFAVKFFGKKGLLFGIYNLALWFAVLYLGQHWAIDILAGIALANAAFLVMTVAWPRIRKVANSTVRIPRPSWPGALSGHLRPAVSRQRADEQSSYLD